MKLTEDDFCPICGDIMEPDDVTGEVRCLTDHPTPDNYDTLFVQRGAEESFQIAADDVRKLRTENDRLRDERDEYSRNMMEEERLKHAALAAKEKAEAEAKRLREAVEWAIDASLQVSKEFVPFDVW